MVSPPSEMGGEGLSREGGQVGDVAIHLGRHKEGPHEEHGTVWLLPGTPGRCWLIWEGTGLREQIWLPGMQEELSEVTLGLLMRLCFTCKSVSCLT